MIGLISLQKSVCFSWLHLSKIGLLRFHSPCKNILKIKGNIIRFIYFRLRLALKKIHTVWGLGQSDYIVWSWVQNLPTYYSVTRGSGSQNFFTPNVLTLIHGYIFFFCGSRSLTFSVSNNKSWNFTIYFKQIQSQYFPLGS